MISHDDLEGVLKDTLKQEASAASGCLEGLESRIVAELGERLPRLGLSAWLRQFLAPSRGVRLGQLAFVGATAAVFLVIGLLIADTVPFLGSPGRSRSSLVTAAENEILFVLPAMNAGEVAVVGNFNSWEPTPLSDEDGDGIWTASVPLAPGRYEYAFVIDGRWWGQDPLADEYVKSFGEYSSVRYVVGGGDGA